MIVKTIYCADNGEQFETKEECLKYEEQEKQYEKFREMARELQDFCVGRSCTKCPFFNNKFCVIEEPTNWMI